MRGLTLAALLVFLTLDCRAGVAQTVPDGELAGRFAVLVAAPWTIQKFTVDASANYGTAVEPVIKSRFHVDLRLPIDTFVVAERADEATFLARVAREGEARIIYGIATAQLRGGAWQIEFDPQNDPAAGSGLPRSAYPGRLIVRGTEEETAYFKEVSATLAATQARLLGELAAKARVATERQALEAAQREAARQIAEKETAAAAAVTRRRIDEAATADAVAQARLTEKLNSLPESLRSSLITKLRQGWVPTAVTV